MTTNIERIIFDQIRTMVETAGTGNGAALTRDTKVFESGLDSLGFAILVAQLEETLGYDPFVCMSEPVYPTTLGEFVDVYLSHRPEQALAPC
jgi:Phosphopantetheine attachment site